MVDFCQVEVRVHSWITFGVFFGWFWAPKQQISWFPGAIFGVTRGRDEVPGEMNVFIVVLISHARELNATEVFFTKQKIPKHEKNYRLPKIKFERFQ